MKIAATAPEGDRFLEGVRFELALMRSPLRIHPEDGNGAAMTWCHVEDGDVTSAISAASRVQRPAIASATTEEACRALSESGAFRAVCYIGANPPSDPGIVDLGGSNALASPRPHESRAELRFAKILGRVLRDPTLVPVSPVGFPIKAMVEIVRACNLRCPVCPVGNGTAKHYDNMTPEEFARVVDAFASTVYHLELYNYGEPLLHPKLDELIRIAKDKGIEHIELTSNGTILRDEMAEAIVAAGLDYIRISIDGATQETYEEYRVGGHIDKVWRNVAKLLEARRRLGRETPVVEAQFVINRYNEHEIPAFRRMAKKTGVDRIRLKTFNALMSGPELADEAKRFLPVLPQHTRYASYEDFGYTKAFKRSECEFPWEWIVVNGDATIVPCCYDYNGRHPLGSFAAKKEHWWVTDARASFSDRLQSDPMSIDMCAACPLCPSS